MTMVKTWAKLLIAVAVLFIVLRYIAEFSATQSWILALLTALGWDLVEGLRNHLEAKRKFAPFWVQIAPNWYDLLQNYNIVQGDEKTFWNDVDSAWYELQKNNSSISIDSYRVLRDGITYTVLKPPPFESLIYWNSHQIFRSSIEFKERIQEIKLVNEIGWLWSPDIYFKWGIDGYELGLEVNTDWWKKMCSADETNQLGKIETHPEFLTGTTRLLIATLPYSEFGVYSAGNAPASWFATSKQKRRDKELTSAGWKREETDWEMSHLGAPESVKHKYFTVSHRAI